MRATGGDPDRELNQGLRWGYWLLAENQAPQQYLEPSGVATRMHARQGHKDHNRNVKDCECIIGKHKDFNSVHLIQKGKGNCTLRRLSRLHAAILFA